MKKVMCLKCKRVFDVDEKKEVKNGVVFCKNCNESFYLEDGIKNLQQNYQTCSKRAYKEMYSNHNYENAYKYYEECLKLKDNDFSSICGMAMCKIYGSTMDELQFNNVINLIEEHDIQLNEENTFIFLSLIIDLMNSFKQFYISSSVSLMTNGVFNNEKFFSYYLSGLKDIKKLIEYIKSALSLCDEQEYADFKKDYDTFEQNFNDAEKEINDRLNATYNINEIGDVKLDNGISTNLGTNIKTIVEPSVVDFAFLPVNTKARKLRNIMIGIFAVLLVAIIVFIVLFFTTGNFLFMYLEFVPVAISIICYFVFKNFMKKMH